MGSSALKTTPPRLAVSCQRSTRGGGGANQRPPTRKRSKRLILDLAALSAFADELECIHFHRGLIGDDTRRARRDGTLQAARRGAASAGAAESKPRNEKQKTTKN